MQINFFLLFFLFFVSEDLCSVTFWGLLLSIVLNCVLLVYLIRKKCKKTNKGRLKLFACLKYMYIRLIYVHKFVLLFFFFLIIPGFSYMINIRFTVNFCALQMQSVIVFQISFPRYGLHKVISRIASWVIL